MPSFIKRLYSLLLILVFLPVSPAQAQPSTDATCLLTGTVIDQPTERFTTLKNDGKPMIYFHFRVEDYRNDNDLFSKRYCQSLAGKDIEVYLSMARLNQVSQGEQIRLIHRHNNGKKWPYWANYFHIVPADQ